MKRIISCLVLIFTVFQVAIAQDKKSASSVDGIVKVLAIGNSFSEDGIENYLHELAAATGKKMIIGNLYIGGAPLSLHLKNAEADKAAYDYRKIDLTGKKQTTKEVSIAQALADEHWDYISFQQASPLSGQYETIIASLPDLMRYVRERVPADSKFVYHQTWAYQQDSNHKGFANYQNDQSIMYKSIAAASKKVFQQGGFAKLIPAGTAVQNARSSSLGDHLTRDGYHLQLDYGRFTAACTWYEELFKEDVRKNPYKPALVTAAQAAIAKLAAHKACKKPYKVSKIKL